MPPKKGTPKRKPSREEDGGGDPKRLKPSPPSPTSSHSSASSAELPDSGVDKDVEKKRMNTYLTIRAGDLGIAIDPAEGEDESDFEYRSDGEDVVMESVEDPMTSLRERCDNLLDTLEEALRTVDKLSNRTLHPEIIFPKEANRKTRNQRRRKHAKTYKLNSEVEPILQMRTSKGKDKKKMVATMSALALRNLARKLSQLLVDELVKRGVQHPRDVARFKYVTKRAKKAEAAKGIKPPDILSSKLIDELLKRGIKYPKTAAPGFKFKYLVDKVKKAEKEFKPPERSLDQQWTDHGLGLRQLLDLYHGQGRKCADPVRKELEEKCRKYGLSTLGENWDLDRSILLYELASKRRLYGLAGETKTVLDDIIRSLRGVKAQTPEKADAAGDDAGDDSDNAGGPFENIPGAKGKGKDTAASGKAAKAKAAATTSTRVTRGAAAKAKTKDHTMEEWDMAARKQLTVFAGDQTQTFDQTNVSGANNRCFWHAVQLLWLGYERERGRSNLERYPVNARVRELWDAVMHPSENVTNPARHTRLALYETLQNDSRQNNHGTLETRIRNMQMGDEDMAQLVADALDVEIFMYRPVWSNDGRVSDWYRIVRGEPQTDPYRQLHLANYSEATHWTALTSVGPFVLPPLSINNRRPTFTEPPNTPPLDRLAPGYPGNVDIRPAARRTSPEDGRVPDLSEEMVVEETDDEEGDGKDSRDDEDGKGGKGGKDDKDDHQDGDGADGMNLDGDSNSDSVMSDPEDGEDKMDIEKPGSDEEMGDTVAAHYASRSRSTSRSRSAKKPRSSSKTNPASQSPKAQSSTKPRERSSPPEAKSKEATLPSPLSSGEQKRPKTGSRSKSRQRSNLLDSSQKNTQAASKATTKRNTLENKLVEQYKLVMPSKVVAAVTSSPKVH